MSKIEVNKIGPQCGTTLTVGCGAGQTVVADAATVTLGRCGGTVALASGATQTGFGRTGTVDWQTGSVKTTTFSASNGEGYFCNTSGGAFTANLPAGSAGAIVSLADYAGTWQTHNLTVAANGTDKIGSVPGASIALNTEGQSVTFVFVDSTQGWINTMDSTSNVRGNPNLVATGGTITTVGDCKIHTFTGPGTFSVSNASTCATNNIVSYLVVAGGGGGGHDDGGGGGAGGYREVKNPVTPYTASPLDGYPSSPNRVTVSATSYPITVGAGGAGAIPGSNDIACNGSPSIFSTITSAGGGFGDRNCGAAGNGGSGGGGKPGSGAGGNGNTPSTSPAQGQNGGTGTPGANQGGGGGGAGATGGNGSGSAPSGSAGPGGAGVTTNINNSPVTRAGGGGGGAFGTKGSGGSGGGGNGGQYPSTQAVAGTANTGGGGGGGSTNTGPRDGKNGGSGLVIIRYKYQ